MAHEKDLLRIKEWFNIYVQRFYTGNEGFDSAIRLKALHTKNVALEILDISNSLGLGAEDCCLAEIIALLHDIGRFEQFARYHMYSDAKSEDHASLGIKVIDKTGVLRGLDAGDNALVRAVISHHNRAVVPESGDARFLFFLKLLRDADKIDILQVVTQHYQGCTTNDVVEIGLPDTPGISDAIIKSVIHGRIARVEDMRTLNDFKLLQIGWVFDLNFPRTFEIVKQRKYLEKIRDALPHTDVVSQSVSTALRYLEKNCAGERSLCQCPTP